MTLSQAQHYARQIVQWLEPNCDRIFVAGSIRRERPICNDIDLVVIPKLTVYRDLLGAVTGTQNHVWMFLVNYANNNPGRCTITTGRNEPGKVMICQLAKCQLDIFFADDKTWATRLLCRTGSKEHNIWLADRAAARSLHWNPYEGLSPMRASQGPVPPAKDEADIYQALGLDYIDPVNREPAWIAKHLDFGL